MKQHLFALMAAGLALAGSAQAAPRERVREPGPATSACPPGFAALQSSGTCVRISGRVRAEAVAGSSRLRSADSFGTGASGRVQLDVRKQTEYGPLRAVIRAGTPER